MTDIPRKARSLPAGNAGVKQRGRPFQKGQSGNPRGKLPGCRHRATMAVLQLMEGDLEQITAALIEKAIDGEPWAIKLVLDKLVPNCKELPVTFRLPRIASAKDLHQVMVGILTDTATGKLTPQESLLVSQVVTVLGITQAVAELEKKLAEIDSG